MRAAPEPTEAMMPAEALGLWQSSFGAVKIEPDMAGGHERLMGVWLYQRDGLDIIGYFQGALRGNVLEFTWNEPFASGDLIGGGYLMFDPAAGRFTGEWWTDDRTRHGTWNGWRPAAVPQSAAQGSGVVPEPGSPDDMDLDAPAGSVQDGQDPGARDRLPW
jgi:hypothetical protein